MSAQAQERANASTATFASHYIQNSSINEGPGVALTEQQKLLVGSVLDASYHAPRLHSLVYRLTHETCAALRGKSNT
jgi:hypothetical protein